MSALGWIVVAGRRELPCRIINLTPKGAFLEMQPPAWLPFSFELLRDGDPAAVRCEIRHVMPNGIGVRFVPGADQTESDLEAITSELAGRWVGSR